MVGLGRGVPLRRADRRTGNIACSSVTSGALEVATNGEGKLECGGLDSMSAGGHP